MHPPAMWKDRECSTKAAATTATMLDQIAKSDGGDLRGHPVRYRRLAVAALKPLVKPTETMIDAAHEAVWNQRRRR